MTNPFIPRGTNPPEPTENLRDARLLQALQHMPDAHMQPSAQTRQAVLHEALRAAAPPPRAVSRWWQAWFGPSDQRMPWRAALTSLAIASFITVLWYGQDVPDATPGRGPVVQREEASKEAIKDSGKERRQAPPVPAAAAPRVALREREMAQKTAPVAVPAAPAAAEALASAGANAVSSVVESRADSARTASPSPAAAAPAAAYAPAPAVMGGLAKAQADSPTAPSLALTISVDGVKRSLHPEQAQNLLNVLRRLSYGPVSTIPQPAEADAALVVEMDGKERWVITPDHVLHQTGVKLARGDISPAQYAALHRLAMEADLRMFRGAGD